MKRLFFALWPDENTRQSIVKLNREIESKNLRKVKADNLHVTLVFLGNITSESEQGVKTAVEKITFQPFVLHFDQLEFWKKPRVLCLTPSRYDDQLQRLVSDLTAVISDCGIDVEERKYRPHITLARKALRVSPVTLFSIRWQADSFCLVESYSTPHGVQYQVIQQW